ncbi:MAG: hypothetical protein GXO86_11340 [Chlorobi bacterium]|nr:hypothetical protein [Chlorobiota bacterium]
MKIIITTLCVLSLSLLSAQDFNEKFQQEYFFGNLPSAKIEAMGRGDAAIGGSVASTFFNSAGLGGIEKQEVQLSYSAPFYALENSNYYYAGYARRILPKLIVAFTVNSFAIGETTFNVNLGGKRYPVTKGLTSNYGLTVAGTPLKGLYLGININLFRLRLFEDANAAYTIHFDGGALYKLKLKNFNQFAHHLQFGVSVNNFTASKINLVSPEGGEGKSSLPMIGRFAAAYFIGTEINLPVAGKGSLDFTLTMEYQNTFNTQYRKSFIVGFETVLWKILAMRLGYFTQSVDDVGFENNRSRITDFTYGFGAIVPLNSLTNEKVPLSIHLDYVSLKAPSYIYDGERLPNMRTFTLRVVWTLKNQTLTESN